MLVRAAREGDLEAVRALLIETWHATYDGIYGSDWVSAVTQEWHSLAALRARLRRPGAVFLLRPCEDGVAGMAFASTPDRGATVLLHQLYVRPDRQGFGVGRALLKAVIERFQAAVAVRLEVEEANRRAVAFYLKHGFVRVCRAQTRGRPHPGLSPLMFEKQLV
ncbi:GNAT family N-acetyltransferase [Aquibium sp. A9E412]|uniref:GNAT family N-acetyltransferase n=1 Tax=Aquibium sp. A9E412 TaxID=2976767 RepID=UPI0025B1D7BB|nr:GNAT family N-acetyltransferase [Aquibium sp. A9E412]MDN2568017.1 GNAT family N-acetyltransferase [Aquibium sp. A9E412]